MPVVDVSWLTLGPSGRFIHPEHTLPKSRDACVDLRSRDLRTKMSTVSRCAVSAFVSPRSLQNLYELTAPFLTCGGLTWERESSAPKRGASLPVRLLDAGSEAQSWPISILFSH